MEDVQQCRIADRFVGRARGFGVTVGPRRDRYALLAPTPADRLDSVALASHLIDETDDQRVRGSGPRRR